jgi:hypothetical protein
MKTRVIGVSLWKFIGHARSSCFVNAEAQNLVFRTVCSSLVTPQSPLRSESQALPARPPATTAILPSGIPDSQNILTLFLEVVVLMLWLLSARQVATDPTQ